MTLHSFGLHSPENDSDRENPAYGGLIKITAHFGCMTPVFHRCHCACTGINIQLRGRTTKAEQAGITLSIVHAFTFCFLAICA